MKKGTIFIIGNNPELSESIQKAFFALGYDWSDRDEVIKLCDHKLVVGEDKTLSILGTTEVDRYAEKHGYEIINLSGYRRFISMEERHPVEGDGDGNNRLIHLCKNGAITKNSHTSITEGQPEETLAFMSTSNPPDPELLKIGLPEKQTKVDVQLTANGKEVSVDEMMELLKEMKGDK